MLDLTENQIRQKLSRGAGDEHFKRSLNDWRHLEDALGFLDLGDRECYFILKGNWSCGYEFGNF